MDALAAELIVLLVVAVVGGVALAAWASGRDRDVDAWSGADVAWTVAVSAAAMGFALRGALLTVALGSVLGAVAVLGGWWVLLGLATSTRHPLVRRVVALPVGVAVAVRGAIDG